MSEQEIRQGVADANWNALALGFISGPPEKWASPVVCIERTGTQVHTVVIDFGETLRAWGIEPRDVLTDLSTMQLTVSSIPAALQEAPVEDPKPDFEPVPEVQRLRWEVEELKLAKQRVETDLAYALELVGPDKTNFSGPTNRSAEELHLAVLGIRAARHGIAAICADERAQLAVDSASELVAQSAPHTE